MPHSVLQMVSYIHNQCLACRVGLGFGMVMCRDAGNCSNGWRETDLVIERRLDDACRYPQAVDAWAVESVDHNRI
jgi:hypothetical protein